MSSQGGLPSVLRCHFIVRAAPPGVMVNDVAKPVHTDALEGFVVVANE